MTVARTPLVGRNEQLGRIGTALDAAVQGDAAFVLVLGEAGVGKTAFLHATAWLAATRGMRVLTGTAIVSGAAIPYLPLMAPLRAAVERLRIDDSAARTVRALLYGHPVADEPDAARAARLVEATYDVLRRSPTLLIVDDVHWADGATLTVLDYLAHRAQSDPLAVVAAARDDEPERLRQLPIADGRRYLQLPLRRLPLAAVREQVAMLAGRPLPESALETLFQRSDGNPLYVEELLAQATAADEDGGDVPPAPASLQSLVMGRVARLAEPARQATDALAVLGTNADLASIAAVAALGTDAAARALTAAEHGGVVVRRAQDYALRHPLFGEVVAAEFALQPHGVAMHRRAAELLEERGATPAEVVGHWQAAGDRQRTWSGSLAAGTQAESSSAFAEARAHLLRAVEHWPETVDGRGEAMLRAAHAAWLSGDAAGALDVVRAARATGASPLEALVAEGQYAWDAGLRPESVEMFVRAGEALADDSPPATRARALWGLGRARIGQGDFADAYRLAVDAASAAAEAGSAAWVSQGWVLAGMARAWAGDIGGIADLERGLSPAIESGDPEAVGHAYQFLVDLLWLAGRLQEARRIGLEGISACERLGLARSHGSDVRGGVGLVLLDLGAWREAEEILDGAEPRAKATHARGLLGLRRGDLDAAERDLDAAATEPAIGGAGRLGGLLELARVELAWLRGVPDEAARELESIPEQPGIWEIDMAARKELWRGRLGHDEPATAVAHFDAGLAEAITAELSARRSNDAQAWLGAATLWEKLERPYEQAIALLAGAEAAYAGGDRQNGRASLETALELSTRLGARPLAERAERLARRARITMRPAQTASASASPLTSRETEVLELLAEGRTNQQIAQHLFLSPKTVGIHVSRVLEKLDAHTRGAAVATARRRGLLA